MFGHHFPKYLFTSVKTNMYSIIILGNVYLYLPQTGLKWMNFPNITSQGFMLWLRLHHLSKDPSCAPSCAPHMSPVFCMVNFNLFFVYW